MNRKTLCILLFGKDAIKYLGEALDEEIEKIARTLEEEYGIILLQEEKPNPTRFFKKDLEAKVVVFKEKPSYPVSDEFFIKDKKKSTFPPPKMGKINSKPKGRKR